ncbi:MAG: aspartate/glutamate racemase family protein [Spirochaetia bacterium]|nr:aspartate/glutamate racemase family protein [Spirochaetia bacterium]
MIYKVQGRQVSYGESIGILLLENFTPFIPGDTANATTYSYPVRFERVEGLSVERIFNHDMSMYEVLKESALKLQSDGVKAITGDCGFMALYQKRLIEELDMPIFLSSLIQLHFILNIIAPSDKVAIITANKGALIPQLFETLNITKEMQQRVHIVGLEDCKEFKESVIDEKGTLDSTLIEECTVQRSVEAVKENNKVKAILLECSMLPPYAKSVQEATQLPVFDYITMINYVHDAIIKKHPVGHM